MISQLQSIRVFIDAKLSDLVLWSACTPEGDCNADAAVALIRVKGKSYRITSTSSYVKPPRGELALLDLETGHEIRGAKGDVAWSEIEAYIRRRVKDEPEPAPVVEALARADEQPKPKYPDDRVPYLGQGVIYCPDWPMGGMTKLAALVTKVISPTMVCLTAFPVTGELFWRENVQRREGKSRSNVWDFAEPIPADVVSPAEVNESARRMMRKKRTA